MKNQKHRKRFFTFSAQMNGKQCSDRFQLYTVTKVWFYLPMIHPLSKKNNSIGVKSHTGSRPEKA
jgi:hypothetical protein